MLRTAALGLAEYAVADLLGTWLRPALLWCCALVVESPALAFCVGKVLADIAFYGVAAAAHRLTQRRGWRNAPTEPAATSPVTILT